MPVVSISRQYGAGGRIVATEVAHRLNIPLVDHEVLSKVAREAGVSEDWVHQVAHEAGGGLWRLVNELVESSFRLRNLPGIRTEFDEDAYRRFLNKVITELADRGDMVILGRGSQFILKNRPETVCIQLVAEVEDRIRSLMERYNVDRKAAEETVHRSEARRIAFLEGFGHGSPEKPHHYHLVINTSLVGHDASTRQIITLLDMFK